MNKPSIQQVELQVSQSVHSSLKSALQQVGYSIPDGYRLRVALLDSNGRKKRSNAAAEKWSPQSGRLQFWLEPLGQGTSLESPREVDEMTASRDSKTELPEAERSASLNDAEKALLKALDRAESTPGWSFVSLKKFRDEILPAEPQALGAAKLGDMEWQSALRSAIDKRLILTSKIANPKSPQFPVTSIRLNRLMPEVQGVLGKRNADLDFHPIRIQGEPLSATILRERR
jgi:hypothetical protein